MKIDKRYQTALIHMKIKQVMIVMIQKQSPRGVLQKRCSAKKVFLEISKKFTGKHLCQSLFFNKVAGLRPATLLEKRLWHRCLPVNF